MVVAFVLTVFALPGSLPEALAYGRPEWVALVLIYWVIATPHRVGVVVAWCCGVAVDLLDGSLMGQHALALVVVAYVAGALYQRMRMFAVWQQGLIVMAICAASQTINFTIESIAGTGRWDVLYFLPSVVSALLWPWMFLVLRFLRRRFDVN